MHPNDQDFANENEDPAAAFAALRGEVALLRRGIEQLAAERADIAIPDYNPTLADMNERLDKAGRAIDALGARPAMQLTPESFAARIDAAGAKARESDSAAMEQARLRFIDAASRTEQIAGTAATLREQRRRLLWAAGGGLLAGILVWSFLPGVILRTLPQTWHMPESMAAHIIGEPTLWDAGIRLMQAGRPAAWSALVAAAQMQHENREAIAACEKAAVKARKPVRCTIRVVPPVGQGESERRSTSPAEPWRGSRADCGGCGEGPRAPG